ncbi:MAG: hypothetical protein HOI59_12115 [Nitrospina sp.]|jgi:hypothetical protein|nr:hypothetical protein [Nitrospina sp.]MBT3414625.1 hypothetical protein [Nitrospina sp.]MBT3857771.1 hypothetical protein [Nitrospina sp.]MBT4103374.1 hypothetical protein [Nitrospina sp.]MBT4390461.1 hypothetical protein [Nitrospina sp.]
MNNIKKLIIVSILMISMVGVIGCEEKGSAEKAGEQLDKTMEDAAKKANELLGK